MFGKNSIQKAEHGSGAALKIVRGSPFRTIQGEGPYAGCPAVFVRLHGCNLACTFCDTNFDDPKDPLVPIHALADSVLALFGPEASPLVVITGGEPLRQNILPFVKLLREQCAATIQIETAGTLWLEGIERLCSIVCSPKTATIHPQAFLHASAFKYLIDTVNEHDEFIPITATQKDARPRRLARPRPGTPVYLNPLDTYNPDCNKRNLELVGQLAMEYGVHAGIQLHKFLLLD